MASGYISFFRGNIPYTFADRIDKGEVPEGLLFTPVIKCNMEDFQLKCYVEATKNFDDKLDRASSAAANFVYPCFLILIFFIFYKSIIFLIIVFISILYIKIFLKIYYINLTSSCCRFKCSNLFCCSNWYIYIPLI